MERPLRIPAVLSCAALLLLPMVAGAYRPAPPPQDLVRLDVIDRDRGTPLPVWSHRGDTWIAGRPGTPYSVRLRNTTGERVLVVLSVDGVNVVSGETAAPDQTGYVLAPWQSTDITGWRKSNNDVARFEFTALPDSYAARTGRPDHVGAIGIAVFRERGAPVAVAAPAPSRDPMRQSARASGDRAESSIARESAAVPQQIGTGHGVREWAPVTRTAFERATRTPAQRTVLRYDSAEALAALGIGPRVQAQRRRPDAFPGGFVPDP